MRNKPDISVIILNYNAEKFLRDTLTSTSAQKGLNVEIIVVDNNSSDNSRSMVKREFPHVKWVQRDTSVGFSAGNNAGLPFAHAETILFLNPDTKFLKEGDLKLCYDKLMSDKKIGVMTARIELVLTGTIDETCHRGFPTPWRSFCHFFGLEKLFPHAPWATGYYLKSLDYNVEHEVEAVGGMFMLMRRSVGEETKWWDEDYPLYGEDIDFCYRIKEKGYKVLYWPRVTVLHYKGVSTGMSKQSRKVTTAKKATTKRVKGWSIKAMELFYDKHYRDKYPAPVTWIVKLGIRLLYFVRVTLA